MNDQTLHTRRRFLRTSFLGAAASWTLPLFLEKTFFALDAMAADSLIQTTTGKDGTILVVLQMAGGNDGLNMVVPFADDAYHRARPKLALPADKILRLNSYAGLNPKLPGLKSLFDDGHLAVIQGVGYPNPNRSHFRSTEIWQTACDADRMAREGWLGRYFDNCCGGADPMVGVAIGNEMPQSFTARTPTGIVFSRPEQYRFKTGERGGERISNEESFYRQLNQPNDTSIAAPEGGSIGAIAGATASDLSAADFLQRTALDAQISSDKILEIARKSKAGVPYPKGQLANSLSLIARMIGGGLTTRVYYASQGGFDTHAGQLNAHDRLMTELNDALAAFVADLKQQGNFEPGSASHFQRVRPAGAGERQWRNRPRRGRADVRPRRESEAGSVWEIPQPNGSGQWRPEVQYRLPERLRERAGKLAARPQRGRARTEIPDPPHRLESAIALELESARGGPTLAVTLGKLHLTPGLAEFEKLARQGNVIPVFAELIADSETPVSAFQKIDDGRHCFLFESAETNEALGPIFFHWIRPAVGLRESRSIDHDHEQRRDQIL